MRSVPIHCLWCAIKATFSNEPKCWKKEAICLTEEQGFVLRAEYVDSFKWKLTFGMAGGVPCGHFAEIMVTVFFG